MGDLIEMMVFAVMVVALATVVVLRLLVVANGIAELVSMAAVDPMPMDRWQIIAMAAVVTAEMV